MQVARCAQNFSPTLARFASILHLSVACPVLDLMHCIPPGIRFRKSTDCDPDEGCDEKRERKRMRIVRSKKKFSHLLHRRRGMKGGREGGKFLLYHILCVVSFLHSFLSSFPPTPPPFFFANERLETKQCKKEQFEGGGGGQNTFLPFLPSSLHFSRG